MHHQRTSEKQWAAATAAAQGMTGARDASGAARLRVRSKRVGEPGGGGGGGGD
ncbi:hypothetical protein JYU34_021569 [Plutella xylostella]|uniref:Uncharacterized protein n=1 Tax=Plutella xylostella TaxID=51655 RepID=A0ABQ7PTV0_PLUXY|nr:hypothetical protein JYU34_021569 [Plutella xylostella]